MKKFRRLLSTLLVMSVICLPMSVCAKESSDESLPSQEVVEANASITAEAEAQLPTDVNTEEGIDPQALGKVLATGTTTIYNGCGTLTINLPAGNYWADLVACIGFAEQNSLVTCTVTDPNGNVMKLGSLVGTGDQTTPYQVFHAPAGNYRFYFASAMTQPYKVIAYIHD